MPVSTKRKGKRLNLRIHEDLLKWVKKYAKGKRTSVTQIIQTHFVELKEREDGR